MKSVPQVYLFVLFRDLLGMEMKSLKIIINSKATKILPEVFISADHTIAIMHSEYFLQWTYPWGPRKRLACVPRTNRLKWSSWSD